MEVKSTTHRQPPHFLARIYSFQGSAETPGNRVLSFLISLHRGGAVGNAMLPDVVIKLHLWIESVLDVKQKKSTFLSGNLLEQTFQELPLAPSLSDCSVNPQIPCVNLLLPPQALDPDEVAPKPGRSYRKDRLKRMKRDSHRTVWWSGGKDEQSAGQGQSLSPAAPFS